jgi:hypothetical protein
MEPMAVRVELRPDVFHSFPVSQSQILESISNEDSGFSVPLCGTGTIAKTMAFEKR